MRPAIAAFCGLIFGAAIGRAYLVTIFTIVIAWLVLRYTPAASAPLVRGEGVTSK